MILFGTIHFLLDFYWFTQIGNQLKPFQNENIVTLSAVETILPKDYLLSKSLSPYIRSELNADLLKSGISETVQTRAQVRKNFPS